MPRKAGGALKRTSPGFLVLVCFLLLLRPAGCGGLPEKTAPAPPPGQNSPLQKQAASDDTAPPDLIPATVAEVIDGDTVRVRLPGRRTQKVRFIGVDTPETRHPKTGEEPYGRAAAAFTKKSLLGRRVWLERDVQERDRYGRLLAYVWLEPPTGASASEVREKMFNARLLLEGCAQVLTVPPNVRYADLFVKFQREAREAKKGLWSGKTPGA